MEERYKLGFGKYTPHFIEDERTGEYILIYIPQNAVANGCKPGEKAGNPLIDKNNEIIVEESLIERILKLWRSIKK